MHILFNDNAIDKARAAAMVLLAFEEDLEQLQCSKIDVTSLDFKGKWLEAQKLTFVIDGQTQQVLLLGLGKRSDFSKKQYELLGDKIYDHMHTQKQSVSVAMCDHQGVSADAAARIAFGLMLKSWVFEKHITKRESKHVLNDVIIHVQDKTADNASCAFKKLNNIASGVHLTKELGCEPANIINPTTFVERAISELSGLGVRITTLDRAQMLSTGMNAVLAVAQGSCTEPRFLVLEWFNKPDVNSVIAFVGKGVTFDSGGISIKPSDHMDEMKYDMSGAGTVLGLMKAIALNKMEANVVCAMPLVENMPSGSATRPGDIIKSMSGQTIEVLNTDAEGRLILADALWYVQNKYDTEYIIDLATLTGAMVVALGTEIAGFFTNDNDLAAAMMSASEETGELLWRMPLHKYYDECMDSKVADIKNIGSPLARCGSITAAQFLQRFVNGKKWAHIDIAGVADSSRTKAFAHAGATAFGIRLLYALLEKHYAQNMSADNAA